MKEASGELSMTAVAVVAIAAVGVLFTTLVWPSVKKSLAHNSACASAYACKDVNGEYTCSVVKPENGTCADIGAADGQNNQCSIVCTKQNG